MSASIAFIKSVGRKGLVASDASLSLDKRKGYCTIRANECVVFIIYSFTAKTALVRVNK